MKKLLQRLRKKVYRTFLASFLVVFVLPVLVLAGYIANTVGILQRDMENQSRLTLEQFKSGLDSQLYSIMQVADRLADNETVLYYIDRPSMLDTMSSVTAYARLKDLQNELTAINVSNADIGVCYVYFAESDTIFYYDSLYESAIFYQKFIEDSGIAYDEWMALLKSNVSGYVNAPPAGGQTGHAVSYIRSIAWSGSEPASVLITMDGRLLEEYRAAFQMRQGVMAAIVDVGGSLLYATDPELEQDYGKLLGSEISGMRDTAIAGGARLTWVRSPDTGCAYVLATPAAAYRGRLTTMVTASVLVLAAVLLAGFFISLLLANRNYRPLGAVLEFVGQRAARAEAPDADEYGYIREVMGSLSTEKTTIEERLQAQYREMRNFAVERLLRGNYDGLQAAGLNPVGMDVTFAGDEFAVAGVRIDGYLQSAMQMNASPDDRDFRLVAFAVRNVFEELLGSAHSAFVADMDGVAAVLVNFRCGERDRQRAYLLAQAETGSRFVAEHFGIGLSIALSDVHETFTGIHQAWREAQAMLSYSHGGAILCEWQERGESCDLHYSYNPEAEQKLINLIVAGDAAAARQALGEIHERNRRTLPMWFERIMMLDLMTTCVKALGMAGLDGPEVVEVEREVKEALAQEGPVGIDKVYGILERVCAMTREKGEAQKTGAVGERVRAILAREFRSSEFSVSHVADRLNINSSYVSTLYKKQTGESILDTLNGLRLAEARKLLRETNRGVESIATAVGYYNSAGFIRAFKKYEGVTPGQYRSNCRLGAEGKEGSLNQ